MILLRKVTRPVITSTASLIESKLQLVLNYTALFKDACRIDTSIVPSALEMVRILKFIKSEQVIGLEII